MTEMAFEKASVSGGRGATCKMLIEPTSSALSDGDISVNFERMSLKAESGVDATKHAENLARHALCPECLNAILLRMGRRRERRFFPYEPARSPAGRFIADTKSLKRMEIRLKNIFSRFRYLNFTAVRPPLSDLSPCTGVLNGIEIDSESFKHKMSAAPLQSAKVLPATVTCPPFVLNATELAAYLDEFLHLPKKMSFMAKSMYA
ncbi:hypothetical protein TTRE_0000657001 [Trichuris trichiura]|uniref:Peroxide-inducible transcript 1 protein n=1 Tax=Trichuris trichiura TaxID=36087 RepID=A0A077ZFG7_TRITR|nr:hypothetical protein TTRE_0000657001 [Trichuris trichiura]